jgi:hypothetical protein
MKAKTPPRRRRKKQRGRSPVVSPSLIAADVRQRQERDPGSKKYLIVRDVARDRRVGRTTVENALKKDRDLRERVDRLVPICEEALPKLQGSEDEVAKAKAAFEAAKAAYDTAQGRLRDLRQELEAAVGSEALEAIEIAGKLDDDTKAAQLWREWQLTIRLLKHLGSPLGAELEELLKLTGLELQASAVPAKRPRYIIAMLDPSAFPGAPATLSAMGFAPADQAVPTLTEEGRRALGL